VAERAQLPRAAPVFRHTGIGLRPRGQSISLSLAMAHSRRA
jgi:hypothetical protein